MNMIKTIYISSLLLAFSLLGCVPSNNNDISSGANPPGINVVMTQGTAESAEPAIAALRKSLTNAATASRGHLPPLELRVMHSNGELVAIHAEVTKGLSEMIFGNTPAARQKKLEATLTALEKAVTTGDARKTITAQTLKMAPRSAFKTPGLTVWAPDGADNPWANGETMPEVVVSEDEAAFVQRLTAQAAKGGNFLVITDGATAKPTATSVPAERKTYETPAPIPTPADAAGRMGIAGNADPLSASAMAPRAGDNIIIQMGSEKPVEASSKLTTVTLPQGAELIGEPVRFEFNKDVLDTKALTAIKHDAAIIKARGASRVILIAAADYVGPMAASDRYASKRGMVVEAVLTMEGVPVERRIEVGARLSVKGSSPEDRAHAREVRIYAVTEKPAKIAATQESKP